MTGPIAFDSPVPTGYVPLGRTGTYVSRLGMGTMTFGDEADEATSARLFAEARDAGINFFDTADMYSTGGAEEILGRLASSHRDELVIASKAYFPMGHDANARGLSRRHLTRAVEASLRRLRTDRLDVFYVHHFDELTPIESVVRTLDDLQRSGKVVYLGVSNWAAWQIATALGVAAREHLARFDVVQPMYSLVRRQVEVEILPLARTEGLGVVTYSPLGGGLLSGKYNDGATPQNARLVDKQYYNARYSLPTDREVAGSFTSLAAEAGVHPVTLAVAWTMAHPDVTAPIVGARDPEQLAPALAALNVDLPADLRDRITALTPPPRPATDRTELIADGYSLA